MSTVSVHSRRILAVWLPRLPTDRIRRRQRPGSAAALDAFSSEVGTGSRQENATNQKHRVFPRFKETGKDSDNKPLAVAAKIDNAFQVAALNDAASRAGLIVGMPLATARAMLPELEIVDADPFADGETLNAIADWCHRFTPLVARDGEDGLLLDITGCSHLFGGESAMMTAVCEALRRQRFVASGAIAGTAVAARALTRVAHGRIVSNGDEAQAVSPLPVAALGVDDRIARGLTRAGLKTIGDDALRQALGQADAPISPRKPVPDCMAEKRFAEPMMTQDAIAAALASLAQVLVTAMERHGKGGRVIEASFFRTDGVVRTIAVEAGQPVTRAHIVSRLFAEKLDALADPLDPGFGFDLMRLSALRTVSVVDVQHGFDTAANEAEDVGHLIDRLAARIGRRRIVRYVPQETHIPDYADLPVPAQERVAAAHAAQEWPVPVKDEAPSRPLRLFGRPEAIEVTADFPDGPPVQFRWRSRLHVIRRCEGPERIAMEWWRDRTLPQQPEDAFARAHPPQLDTEAVTIDGSVLTRDYFRIEDRNGARFWLYREGIHLREVMTFRWFLHGLFA
jgi:protein ImuB